MKLENLNLVELSVQEKRKIDGGIIPLIIIGACFLFSGCAALRTGKEAGELDAQRKKNQ
jgi:hypothetical protein